MATRRSSRGTTTRLVRRTPSRAGCCRFRRRDSERHATSLRLMELRNSRTIPSKHPRSVHTARADRCLFVRYLRSRTGVRAGLALAQHHVIVPLGAGSASDILARVMMEQVGKQLGQAAIVENRPGAGGTIGANIVAKAAPDGYTVLVYGALASAHALHEKLAYDSVNDLIPVASLGQQILVVIS